MEAGEKFVRVGVGVLVVNSSGQILLGKRKSKLGENTFSLPGGHLEFGEKIEDCARRELKEETDLDGSSFEVVSVSNDIAYDKHYITIGVVVKDFQGKIKVMEKDKCEEWNWYDMESLPEPLFVPSARFIENFSNSVFYK
jgi:8-oxo-dGTP diphosphatase